MSQWNMRVYILNDLLMMTENVDGWNDLSYLQNNYYKSRPYIIDDVLIGSFQRRVLYTH